ncbi:MAG TPA: NFACT family protein [Candidatus Nanoarchaeia archaeon]|nr:NFACT family protein [Candidatus Nanoarchaeia archaeon]
MKAGLASIEIHYLVEELQFLIGGRVDNIYNPSNEELLIQFFVSGKSKQMLRIISGKFMYLASEKEEAGSPSGFCMLLRKHLGNAKLRSIRQIEPERIVEMLFEKDEIKKVIVELFGKGNILICDKEDNIISALVYHKFKDREIKQGLKYSYPQMGINLFDIAEKEIEKVFAESGNTLVKTLATCLGLGGTYSEEICNISGVDKNKKASEAKQEINPINKALKRVIKGEKEAAIIFKDKEVKDIVPIKLNIFEGYEQKVFKSYNEALDHYFLSVKEVPKNPQIEKLKRIIVNQEEKIKSLEHEEITERQKGDYIYQNYASIGRIVEEIKEVVKKEGWGGLEKKAEGHKIVKAVKAKDKTVEIEL